MYKESISSCNYIYYYYCVIEIIFTIYYYANSRNIVKISKSTHPPHITDQFYTQLQKDYITSADILCTILMCLIIHLSIYICFNDVLWPL